MNLDSLEGTMSNITLNQDKDDIKSCLSAHKVDAKNISVQFYTYYNDESTIFYELKPFIAALKPVSIDVAIKNIPPMLLKRAYEFGDEKFSRAKIDGDTYFGESSAVEFAILSSDNKQKRAIFETLYRMCIHQSEKDRIINTHRYIRKLEEKHDKHSSILESCESLLRTLCEKHDDISSIIRAFTNK